MVTSSLYIPVYSLYPPIITNYRPSYVFLRLAQGTKGCHVNNRKWKECADSFDATPPYLQDIYRKDEEKEVRRLKEKYAAEYKRVCGTMGWRDYNVGNLSAMETGDLGVVEVKMKQIIEEQDAVKMDKDEEKARQLRLSN